MALVVASWSVSCGGQARDVVEAPLPAEQPTLPVSAVAAEIGRMLGEDDSARVPMSASEGLELASVYGAEHLPVWLDARAKPSRQAREAMAIIDGAASDGLRPADYGAAELARFASTLDAVTVPPVRELAAFDLSLSRGMLRFWRHLHAGRVDPRAIGFKLTVPADDHDFAAALVAALEAHELHETTEGFRPPLVLYRSLRGALSEYRALSGAPPFETLTVPARSIKPGEPYADIHAVRRQLVALGDLPADTPESSRYEGALVDGVMRFQMRHGLEPDGVLGRGTIAALNVPMADRVVQIELALERLRWLPHLDPDRFLAVNIPMFQLWGWDGVPADGRPSFAMNVIVGRALSTETPVFAEEMDRIVFRPYWNVPHSILRGEIVPALRRDPDYLERHDMEIVAGQGDRSPVVAPTAETIARLGTGALRVRQRPGPSNSLGLVKFVFPNDDNIYMHDTPAPQLFGRPRRDFSHGCIRLEDPIALAEWALRGQEDWTRDRMVAAMRSTAPQEVRLARPIQVILFYVTAVVMPADGTVRFADDIYGHDARLVRALAAAAT